MTLIKVDFKEIQKKKEELAKRIEDLGEVKMAVNSGIYACSCSGGCDGTCESSCSGRCYGCGKS
jgi:hypothetical protein